MYDQKQPDTSLGYEPAKLANKLVSPLQSALNDNGEQIEKLSSLLLDLTERLSLVRNTSPRPSEVECAVQTDFPPASPVIDQVRRQTSTVRGLQVRVTDLMQELEV
jgi:hypothetical protein